MTSSSLAELTAYMLRQVPVKLASEYACINICTAVIVVFLVLIGLAFWLHSHFEWQDWENPTRLFTSVFAGIAVLVSFAVLLSSYSTIAQIQANPNAWAERAALSAIQMLVGR